jgi:hypothetical protein
VKIVKVRDNDGKIVDVELYEGGEVPEDIGRQSRREMFPLVQRLWATLRKFDFEGAKIILKELRAEIDYHHYHLKSSGGKFSVPKMSSMESDVEDAYEQVWEKHCEEPNHVPELREIFRVANSLGKLRGTFYSELGVEKVLKRLRREFVKVKGKPGRLKRANS